MLCRVAPPGQRPDSWGLGGSWGAEWRLGGGLGVGWKLGG